MHRFIDQVNVSITTNRTCTLRCDHCYISPEQFKIKDQITRDDFKLIFDRIEELIESDRNIKTVEWEAIGGETTMMPFEFWEEMLPYALDRIKDINTKIQNPGSLNFLTNLIYRDKRYTDLFNQYKDNELLFIYTSWEPDTNRFGRRNQLYKRWTETLASIETKNKILDIIFTDKVVELGPKHLIDNFIPLGITDFSIKMLSPYGSGKKFFAENMTHFHLMSDYLIELDKIKPKNITFTPQEEMMGSLFNGKGFQCNGNFKYDLSVEPNGETHFNANQTGSEKALGSRVIHLSDKDWAKKVVFENTKEQNAKLSLYHDVCKTCEYMTYCNSGWYHYKYDSKKIMSEWGSQDCPGYKKFWDYNKEKYQQSFNPTLKIHINEFKKKKINESVNYLRASELPSDYDEFIQSSYSCEGIILDEDLLFMKNKMELIWFYNDIGKSIILESIDDNELGASIVEHYVNNNADLLKINHSTLVEWVDRNEFHICLKYKNFLNKIIEEKITEDDLKTNEYLIRYILKNEKLYSEQGLIKDLIHRMKIEGNYV